MQNFNFFQWIRDGVKQSVLLGVSDAVEAIGAPEDSRDLHPAVAAMMGKSAGSSRPLPAPASEKSGSVSRKRLGRSLKDIEPTT